MGVDFWERLFCFLLWFMNICGVVFYRGVWRYYIVLLFGRLEISFEFIFWFFEKNVWVFSNEMVVLFLLEDVIFLFYG